MLSQETISEFEKIYPSDCQNYIIKKTQWVPRSLAISNNSDAQILDAPGSSFKAVLSNHGNNPCPIDDLGSNSSCQHKYSGKRSAPIDCVRRFRYWCEERIILAVEVFIHLERTFIVLCFELSTVCYRFMQSTERLSWIIPDNDQNCVLEAKHAPDFKFSNHQRGQDGVSKSYVLRPYCDKY